LGCTLDFISRSWPIHPMCREERNPQRLWASDSCTNAARRSLPGSAKSPVNSVGLPPSYLAGYAESPLVCLMYKSTRELAFARQRAAGSNRISGRMRAPVADVIISRQGAERFTMIEVQS
jgi:hypothetical protein